MLAHIGVELPETWAPAAPIARQAEALSDAWLAASMQTLRPTWAPPPAEPGASSMRDNVLYIHSHDTGRYVQPYGHAIPTPNIQWLADQGATG